MKHVAVSCGFKVSELLEKVAWPLYDKYSEGEPPGHALTGLTELLKYVPFFFLLFLIKS